MGNTIKRNTNKMKIKTLVEFGGGKTPTPAGTEITIKKDEFGRWTDDNFCWSVGHLRNNNIIEILEQEHDKTIDEIDYFELIDEED